MLALHPIKYLFSIILWISEFPYSLQYLYTNIKSIQSLQSLHNFGLLENSPNYFQDDEYNFCLTKIMDRGTPRDQIFGPFYKFVLEFTPTILPCSPCPYSNRPNVTWMKLSFENRTTLLKPSSIDSQFGLGRDDSLILKNPTSDEFGTYYCLIHGFVGYIWSVEVEPFNAFHIIKARHWKDPLMPRLKEAGLHVSFKWNPWSSCNKCNQVGKRHRLGYCFVEATPSPEFKWKSLEIYNNGLSCNLFVLLNPDSNPDIIETLEQQKPVLLIGYCKIPCDYFDISPDISYSRVHPQIHSVYQNQIEMRTDLELVKLEEKFSKRKQAIIPGKPTFLEGFTVTLFILFQIYLIFHIWKNRNKAN